MPQAKPSFRPRPSGGFNQGVGQFGEGFDESIAKQAMQQKALGQQQVASGGAAAAAAGQKMKGQPSAQRPPRSVGSLTDELIKRPVQDIGKELSEFFSLNTWLGIDPHTEDPQKKQRLTAAHKRYQQLDQEQQAFARQKYQEDMKKKQLEEQEKERKKRMQEQEKQNQALPMPSSPKKGPIGPGMSGKQKAAAQLQHDRQRLSTPSGSN